MKELYFAFAIFCAICTHAQDKAKPKVNRVAVGLHAGLNYSKFRGYVNSDPGSLEERRGIGYLAGFHTNYRLTDELSLRLELNYERKSQHGDNTIHISGNPANTFSTYKFSSNRNSDYFIVPLMAKYVFTPKSKLFVTGGIYYGHLLQSDIVRTGSLPPGLESETDTSDANRQKDSGLVLGMGKDISIGKNTLSIEIRQNMGMTNTSNSKLYNVKTNSLGLIVGFAMN